MAATLRILFYFVIIYIMRGDEINFIFIRVFMNKNLMFKFITLNLWFGGVLFDNILDFLKKEKRGGFKKKLFLIRQEKK